MSKFKTKEIYPSYVETPKPAKDYRNAAASSMYHMVCTVYVHTKCGGILANFPQLKFVLP